MSKKDDLVMTENESLKEFDDILENGATLNRSKNRLDDHIENQKESQTENQTENQSLASGKRQDAKQCFDQSIEQSIEQDNVVDLTVDQLTGQVRIDKYLSDRLPEYSRSFIQKIVKDGGVTVNGKPVKSNYKVELQDKLEVQLPELVEPEITAEDIPLDILYEDDDLIVVNKPKGMVVHPAAGHYSGTLVNALMYHCRDNLSGINGVMRPGIVHRIDMNTTGALVVCKNDFTHNSIASQLSVHSITRKYNAIVYNGFHEMDGTVDAPIGRNPVDRKKMAIDRKNGRRAVTHYHVLESFQKYSYIECQLETGRTHQIRVHMASIGHPLLGDDVYCSAKSPYHLQGQTLHARVLGFIHPRTGKYMEFEAPMPEYFNKILDDLRNKSGS